jgi:hypothetical protein
MRGLTHGIVAAAAVVASTMLGASTRGADPEVFPRATFDRTETAALAGGEAVVYRTHSDFGIVLSYYRFKRKQAVHVVEEELDARFRNIASALERPEPPRALLLEPVVRRFHQFRFGHSDVPVKEAAAAWRELAKRHAGRVQRVGEGERVTLYRPYLSQRTFELIDETVIVLRTHGGQSNAPATPTSGADRLDRPDDGVPRFAGTRPDR